MPKANPQLNPTLFGRRLTDQSPTIAARSFAQVRTQATSDDGDEFGDYDPLVGTGPAQAMLFQQVLVEKGGTTDEIEVGALLHPSRRSDQLTHQSAKDPDSQHLNVALKRTTSARIDLEDDDVFAPPSDEETQEPKVGCF